MSDIFQIFSIVAIVSTIAGIVFAVKWRWQSLKNKPGINSTKVADGSAPDTVYPMW